MINENRKFLMPLAELLDRLSIDQIKEVLLSDGKECVAEEMQLIQHDIDLLIAEKSVLLSARLIRIVIALSQLNLHIWYLKDRMKFEHERYDELLKLAHQLNGVKNRLKNNLLHETGESSVATNRSNIETDGLTGWDISV